MFFAERSDPGANLIADLTHPFQPYLACTGEFRGIVEGPVQPASNAGKNWTTFSFGFATDRHHKLKYLSGDPNIEGTLRRVLRYVDFELPKRLHG